MNFELEKVKLRVITDNFGIAPMAKPPVVEDKQIDHMLKVAIATSRMPKRDAALLLTLYGTGMATTELATVTVGDYIDGNGKIKTTSAVRPDVAHNGTVRALYWTNKRLANALDAYLAWRLAHNHGVTVKRGAWRGLDPHSSIFLTDEGEPYALTKRTLKSGKISYSSNVLGAVITRLHEHAGVHGGSAQSARRTLAVKLHRQGYDLVHIAAILGHKSVETTQRMVSGDPVRLGDIVASLV